MEILRKMIHTCMLVLLMTVSLTTTVKGHSGRSDVVHVEHRPLTGHAQIWWPHEHWGKKKKKKKKPKPKRYYHGHRISDPPKHWDNKFDKPLNVNCNKHRGEGLVRVRSRYKRHYFDRQWKFNCHKVSNKPLINCQWSGHINNMQKPFSYMCPKNKIMAGIRSFHQDAPKEDRQWKVRCCSSKGHVTKRCKITKKLNNLQSEFDHRSSYTAKEPGVFVGFQSLKHINTDRRFQMIECHFAREKSCRKARRKPPPSQAPPTEPGNYVSDISPYDLHFKFVDYLKDRK